MGQTPVPRPHEEYWFLTSNSPPGSVCINTPDVWKRVDLHEWLWCSDDQSLVGGFIDPGLVSHQWDRQEQVKEAFVPLVDKPALVTPNVPSPWTLEDHWSIVQHVLCLPPRLSSQSTQVHKQNNQNNTHGPTVSEKTHCFWTHNKYPSVRVLLLTLICSSYLTYKITFLTTGKWRIIPHSLWSMPSRRAFFQKTPTWIHQYKTEMPRCALPNALCIFPSPLCFRDILPNQLGFAIQFPRTCLFLLQMSRVKCYD